MQIHFIAIGGSAMHNLAIALKNKGYVITGSDDVIFEPSKSRLDQHNLLPDTFGWFPDKINTDIEAIILGMHARSDNPELLKAQELGIKIYSYPEFLYEQSKFKTRVSSLAIIVPVRKPNMVEYLSESFCNCGSDRIQAAAAAQLPVSSSEEEENSSVCIPG